MKKEISIPEGFEATIEGNKIILKKTESEDEKIRKTLKHYLEVRRCQTQSDEEYINCNNFLAWLEKQGNQKSKKASIWKHWKNGIAGNGEGKPIYLVKAGNTYNLSSCLCFECDYIELSELDNLILEKQGEQKLPIEKLPEEMKTIGESLGFTTQEECDEYNQIVSDLIMSDDKGKQKKVERGEPKFKVGNWYQCTKDFFGKGVTFDKNTAYYCAKEGCLQDEYGCHIAIVKDLYDNFKLWTIQDVKDGDVVSNGKMIVIFKYFEEPSYRQHIVAHIGLDTNGDIQITDDTWNLGIDKTKPATKEQRDTLFAKMKEAGYAFDFEKKELKKIKQNPTKNKGMNLKEEEMTPFQKEVFYIIDTNIEAEVGLKQECDILLALASNEIEQKSAWSEEDEKMLNDIDITLFEEKNIPNVKYRKIMNWLKYIKERYTWRPSDEQMTALDYYTHIYVDKPHGEVLSKLIKDLKKLKGE